MNPKVQRYVPPIVVFGAAIFFGWPPSAPLDLGEDVVRATSVRWRAEDLASPPRIQPASDPFQEVLVQSDEVIAAETAAVAVIPTGPSEQELQAGLQLDGFANMAGRTWAVLNGRPRLPGDHVMTNDANRHDCQIMAIETDHIVVRCEETIAKIHARPFGTGRSATARQVPVPKPNDESSDLPMIDEVAPPPQA